MQFCWMERLIPHVATWIDWFGCAGPRSCVWSCGYMLVHGALGAGLTSVGVGCERDVHVGI
jgi:hypothetical protein